MTAALVLDLVAFVANRPRPRAEVMDAWRTSCPRLTIWEDALDAGLVALDHHPDGTLLVCATTAGLERLRLERGESLSHHARA